MALDDGLPKRVKIFNPKSGTDKVLKLSYTPLWNSNETVERLMIIAEDFSEAEEFHRKAQMDQLNFFFLKEVIAFKENKILPKNLERSIKESLMILERFISPLSDTYSREYFIDKILLLKGNLDRSFSYFIVLKSHLDNIISDDWVRESFISSNKINYQFEVTEKVCVVIETLIRYANSARLLTKKK